MQDSGGYPQKNANTSCHAKLKKWLPRKTTNLSIEQRKQARAETPFNRRQFFGFFIRSNAVNYQ
jgi:hypothetical protein